MCGRLENFFGRPRGGRCVNGLDLSRCRGDRGFFSGAGIAGSGLLFGVGNVGSRSAHFNLAPNGCKHLFPITLRGLGRRGRVSLGLGCSLRGLGR